MTLLLLRGVLGFWADPVRIDEEFRKAWLPYFCRSGQRETNLEEFAHEVEGWLPVLLYRGLLVDCLLMWFIVKGLVLVAWTAGVGGNLRCCPLLGLMVLHVFCLVLRILGFGPRGCLMLDIEVDFHGRLRVLRSMFIPGALQGIEASSLGGVSMRKLRAAIFWVVWSRRQPFASVGAVLSWTVRRFVILLIVLSGLGFVCFEGTWLVVLGRFLGFIGC